MKLKRFLTLLAALAAATSACVRSSPTAAHAIVPTTGLPPPPTSPPPGRSRTNPMPMHQELVFDNIEALMITRVLRPADHVVDNGTFYNAPPDPGNEYIIITVRHRCIVSSVTNQRCRLKADNYTLTGSSDLTRHPEDARGLPEMMTAKPFYGGIIATGGILFQVAIDETDLVLIYDPWPWLDLPPGYFDIMHP